MKATQIKTILAGALIALTAKASATDLYVPDDYPNIQTAVDAALAGDTIHIAAGVYLEQVIISNKNLTLIGQPGTILRAFPGMALSFPGYEAYAIALVGVFQADVTVSGLSFEGEWLGGALDLVGVYFLGGSGRVEDCRFTGFRGSTLGANQFCVGVVVFNPVSLGTGVVDIQVHRCSFADNARGLNLRGDGPDQTVLRTTIAINDNTIVGSGPDDTGRQFGIFISGGVLGEAKRNIITDHSCVDPTEEVPYSIGLNAGDGNNFDTTNALEALQPLHIEGNIFRDNQIHMILLQADGSTVANNSFEGTAPGLRPTGLGFSGENLVVATNRFSDVGTGITLFGDDPDFGTSLAIASNATLTANRFCDLATNIWMQPLTSATETGNLTCPFPEPVLDIASAVLLSWPEVEEGFIVQCAPTMSGPWTNLTATYFLQDGNHSAATPTDSDQKYFRLMKEP